MSAVHVAHRWLARLIVAAIAVQFLLAGAGAFGATSFRPHTGLGWAIAAVSLLIFLAATAGRRELRASAILLAAVALQLALGLLGEHSSAWFGALHGLNALAVLGAAVNLARRTASLPAATASDRPPSTAGPRSPSR